MFLNIRIDLLILKTYYGQFTLKTKKSLHIIFNARGLSGILETFCFQKSTTAPQLHFKLKPDGTNYGRAYHDAQTRLINDAEIFKIVK